MPEPKLPLNQYIKAQQFTDYELRQILRDTATDASRMVQGASNMRTAQVQLARQQVELWASVKDHTKVGIGDAVDAAALTQSIYDEEFMRAMGIDSSYWRMSVLAQSRAGITNLISRRENNISLSEKVYKNRAWSTGKIDRVLNSGIALGKSAAEIAADVRGFISPDVPGGVSYAANRLARTELNNAFHTTQVKQMVDNPFVERAKWNLSGSHPKPDECNEYADSVHMIRGGPGEFRPEEVPDKPHPNCLCYITPVEMDIKRAKQALQNGEFDSYISDQLGCGYIA